MGNQKLRLSFSAQMLLGMAIMGICTALSFVLHKGIFHNLAWVSWGLLFFFHPIWPKEWDYADHQKLRKGARIAGILAIAWGLLTRFSV